MVKIITTSLMMGLCLIVGRAVAQPQVAGKPERLISKPGQICMGAVWAPDGQFIAFTSERHDGIWVCDPQGQNISRVTGDAGAGFGFSWSADSRTILARPAVLENNRRYHMVKTYEVASGAEKVVVGKSRNLTGLPVWSHHDTKVAVILDKAPKEIESGKVNLKSLSGKSLEPKMFAGNLIATTSADLKPVGFPDFEGRFVFNSRVSPSGEKVVFQVSGQGLYVSNADGSDLRHLGYGEHASWMPDEQHVVVTLVKDDGHRVTSGALYAVNVATGVYIPLLTDPDVVALKPAVSPDGKWLLFDNLNDGAVYKLPVTF